MPRLRAIAFVAFAAHDVEPACRPFVQAGAVDLATVDSIARLQLQARRAGLEMTLHSLVPELESLLVLTGLDAIVAVVAPPKQ